MNCREAFQPEFVSPVSTIPQTCFLHPRLRNSPYANLAVRACDAISGILARAKTDSHRKANGSIVSGVPRCSATDPCTCRWKRHQRLFSARSRCQIHHYSSQAFRCRHTFREWQAQRRIPERQIEAVRVKPGQPPWSVFGAKQLGGVQAYRFGMVVVHMRNGARFRLDKFFRVRKVGHYV